MAGGDLRGDWGGSKACKVSVGKRGDVCGKRVGEESGWCKAGEGCSGWSKTGGPRSSVARPKRSKSAAGWGSGAVCGGMGLGRSGSGCWWSGTEAAEVE